MVKAKKHFGQNFLNDVQIISKIIEAIPNNEAQVLVEIGAGLGDLTKRLLEIKKVVSYEIDTDLSALLKKKFQDEILNQNLVLVETDVLKVWQNSLSSKKYNLVANLPYYVATNIILKALDDENCLGLIVMIQKEVAQKFCAKVGEKDFSSLSIISQLKGEVKCLFDVAPECFSPAPKVMSSVLSIIKFDDINLDSFKQYLKVAFRSPRKTLSKNLATAYSKEQIQAVFELCKLELNLRAHQVSSEKHHHLFTNLQR